MPAATKNWWNWCARDPRNGRLKTFWTNGKGAIATPEQLRYHVGLHFAHLDFADFSCERTDKMPQNKRDTVPLEYRHEPEQLKRYRELFGDDNSPVNKSKGIFYGSASNQSQERVYRAPDRVQRPVPIFHGSAKRGGR